MLRIKCPSCGKSFSLSEHEHASIVTQVRDVEFERSVRTRVLEVEEGLQSKYESEMKVQVADAVFDLQHKLSDAMAKLQLADKEHEIEMMKLMSDSEQKLQVQKSEYERQLREQQSLVDYYKDLKSRMSTKMVGESLEQHCLIEFNKLRATAFRNAYFEKDNDARSGSKGDFIYREYDEHGNEIISIMFEMKNEMDSTEKKHKNEQFFKELDKDRREKNCEYAVLVSLLEADNELYNTGIVDVSYQYDKMYVIRPQFFIVMITVLRNAALNALCYKQELAEVRNQNLDIENFEQALNDFRKGFDRNYELASRQFDSAIDEIDKTIDHLQKVKSGLLSASNNLRLANNKADALTIRRLVKDSPALQEMFDD